MKKLFTVIAALTMCGSIFAQYESYWPDFDYGPYEDEAAFVAAIAIDGQIVNVTDANWDALEVAAFVGDDECRANGMYLYDGYVIAHGDPFPILDGLAIFYTYPGDVVYFKMYDHVNEILYENCEVTLLGEPFVVITGDENMQGWVDPENPIILNFVTPEPDIIVWNDPGDWPDGEVPTEATDVVIPANTEVVIEEGCTAYANSIEMGENSVIVIEEGGELYHNDLVELTIGMNVDGYGTEAKDSDNNGYRLIASPTYTDVNYLTRPVEGTSLNMGVFDLYKFDQNIIDAEWVNYEQGSGNAPGFTDLYLKEGYLYANEDNHNIIFYGYTLPTTADYASSSQLVYNDDAICKGWNLMGNPFTCKATVTGVDDFYVMNEAGNGFVAVSAANVVVNPMQGIFVQATAPYQWVAFTPGVHTNNRDIKLNLKVNGNNGDYDLARIRFGQGQGLEKFMFNENHTKIYFPVDNKDYAVIYAEEIGEMPVCFTAENNGTYTLTFSIENVEFSYLHLIDNMTGVDIDLLASPSYTFNANWTDYESRFKLVFICKDAERDNDSFAFYSNGSWIIDNEGEATVQVIDVNGRILKSENINGCANVNVNAATGVYLIRLVNGNDVKTQKVVVK